jgi:integrase
MANSTLEAYKEIIDRIIRPELGHETFDSVKHSRLAAVVTANTNNVKKKTYNNIVSAIRTCFKFGYKDHPGKFNPALALPGFRITARDRPRIDPFTIHEADEIISASHQMHGEWFGNYQEFLFFTALRQSELFALEVEDCNLTQGRLSITKTTVGGRAKNRTKTNQDREIDLCPRALIVLRQQLTLRARMVAAGKINHRCVFFTTGGEPFRTVYLPYNQWRRVMKRLSIRYRKPYNSRHSFISWRLMIGHNSLLVAQEAGHSVFTMDRNYAAWTKDARPADIDQINGSMAARPSMDGHSGTNTDDHLRSFPDKLLPITTEETKQANTKASSPIH